MVIFAWAAAAWQVHAQVHTGAGSQLGMDWRRRCHATEAQQEPAQAGSITAPGRPPCRGGRIPCGCPASAHPHPTLPASVAQHGMAHNQGAVSCKVGQAGGGLVVNGRTTPSPVWLEARGWPGWPNSKLPVGPQAPPPPPVLTSCVPPVATSAAASELLSLLTAIGLHWEMRWWLEEK